MDTGTKIGIAFIVLCIFGWGMYSFSSQNIAKNWGGEMDVTLEPNQKLVEVTWKDSSLWFLTKEMTEDDVAEAYNFYEKDALGILEGQVHIYEVKMSAEEIAEYKAKQEEQLQLYNDYYRTGNVAADGTYQFIQYNMDTGEYVKLKDYTYDEFGGLTATY